MKTQTQRRSMIIIGDCLMHAEEDMWDAFQEMVCAYECARDNFKGVELDPDPQTIILGLQAQALGIKTLCTWLNELTMETSVVYGNHAMDALKRLHREMDRLGLVIPDRLTL